MSNPIHEWDNPVHLSFFEYNEDGDITGYRGYAVSQYVECPKHGFYPTIYGGQWEIRCHCPKCLEERLMAEKLKGSAIPKRFQNRSIESFVATDRWQQQALAMVKSYADNLVDNMNQGRCIVMAGNPGTGKTHLSIGIARKVIEQRGTAVYLTVSDLILRVRDSWGTGQTTTLIDGFAEVDLLILDEVGVQAGSDNERNIVFDVINKRYAEMKPTIVLTNLNRDGCIRFLGQRVWDRLTENGGMFIGFGGSSYRQKAQSPETTSPVIRKMKIPAEKPIDAHTGLECFDDLVFE